MTGPKMWKSVFNMASIWVKNPDSSNPVNLLFALRDGVKELDLQIRSVFCKYNIKLDLKNFLPQIEVFI